jgi:hypothetical protein
LAKQPEKRGRKYLKEDTARAFLIQLGVTNGEKAARLFICLFVVVCMFLFLSSSSSSSLSFMLL